MKTILDLAANEKRRGSVKKYIMKNVALCFVFFLIGCSVGMSPVVEIREEGNRITLRTKHELMIAEKEGVYKDDVVIVGGGINPQPEPGLEVGGIAFLPFAKFKQLTAQYGDIRKCLNSGSQEAKAAVKNMNCIAATDEIRNKIKKVVNAIQDGSRIRSPLIQIDAVRLGVIKNVIVLEGQEFPAGASIGSYYLIRDLKVLKWD
ncbi:MAG: hypothetical protein WCJ71_01330 [Candidatus Omnitrophota bacterium]